MSIKAKPLTLFLFDNSDISNVSLNIVLVIISPFFTFSEIIVNFPSLNWVSILSIISFLISKVNCSYSISLYSSISVISHRLNSTRS